MPQRAHVPSARLPLAIVVALSLLLPAAARPAWAAQPPIGDAWVPLSAAGAPSPRLGHSAVWTGTEMLVWGGSNGSGPIGGGGRYDPASDTWAPLPEAGGPGPRHGHSAVWTGAEMLVWGGVCLDGCEDNARYNPATNAWQPLSNTGAPSERWQHSTVWTGTEMIVWGGMGPFGSPLGDGGRYNPATDTWTPVSTQGAPAPRSGHAAVWTGREMIVWGGAGGRGQPFLTDGARYDPAADAWTPLPPASPGLATSTAVWTGTEMLVGGVGREISQRAAYDPATDSWRVPPPPAGPDTPLCRMGVGLWTGTEMLIWAGGSDPQGGVRYDPATGTCARMAVAGSPSPRTDHSAVWTGRELIIWGGVSPGAGAAAVFADGGRYFPPGSLPPPPPAAPPVVHDERYFPQTGYRVDDGIWAFFRTRGGLNVFGFPVSRTFTFLGCPVQVFQRQIAQVCAGRDPAFMNVLDPDIFPFTRVNFSTFPTPDEQLKAATPKVGDPNYDERILQFVREVAPDEFEGVQVNFERTFFGLITPEMAGTTDPGILGILNLQTWGAPISRPMRDPNNPNFIYQRFQRGIMHHVADEGVTRGILLADYLKQMIWNSEELPADLRQQSGASRFFRQYCPGAPGWLCRPDQLPGTDLTHAFEPG